MADGGDSGLDNKGDNKNSSLDNKSNNKDSGLENDIKDSGLNDIKEKTPDIKMSERGEREKYVGRIPIPYIEDFQDFNCWVDAIRAWSDTTEIPIEKQGYVLANDIPVSSSRFGASLREDLYKEVKPSTLTNNKEGVEQVLKFLQDRIYIDTDEEIYQTYNDIKTIRRKPGQTVSQYIIEYDKMLQKAKQLGVNNPNDKVLAMDLMITADLNSTEFMMIRTVANVSAADGKRYQAVKQKMREIFGKLDNNTSNNVLLTNSKKEDDIQNHDEAYLAKGWRPPKKNKQYQNRQNRYQKSPKSKNNNSSATNGDGQQIIRRRRQNPPGPNGKPLKCKGCKAETHFLIDCPDAFENSDFKNKKFQTVFITNNETKQEEKVLLEVKEEIPEVSDTESEASQEGVFCAIYVADNKEDLSAFTAEALNKGALDTCCTANVAGEKWTNIYLESIPKELKHKVIGPTESKRQFIFGNQGKLKATAKYTIPVRIGGEENMITIDVISSDIPLLISKSEMKKLGIALDMKNDRGTINGKPLILNTTSAGHYVVDLLNDTERIAEVNISELEDEDDNVRYKALRKIHLQFGHRSKKQFVTILKEAGKWKEEYSTIIDTIMDKCEGCLLRRKTPDRPAVAPPMSSDFGEVLGMDLKVWDKNKGIYILYMIDTFTRFQVATVIYNKEPETIVKALTTKWFAVFGKVNKIITDNGTEFCNEHMREVAAAFDIILLTTGANSPWMNGTIEKGHHTTDGVVVATKRDFPNMSLEVAVAWAVTAVNAMSNVRGFSPHQLVFGRQSRLPNIIEDPPAAWEEPSKSKTLLETLEAMHATRVAYIKNERCDRLRRALKAKIRVADQLYEHGDIVYFKKEGEDTWRGPAKVVFQDSKVIFLRMGSVYYRVSANRITKAGAGLANEIRAREAEDNKITIDKNTETHNIKTRRQASQQNIDDNDKQPTPDQESLRMSNDNEAEDNVEDDNGTNDMQDIINYDQSTQGNNRIETQNDNPGTTDNKTGGRKRKKTYQKPEPDINEDGTIANAAEVLKKNDRIEIFENGKWEKGIVLGHGGKVGGKHAGWYNIQLDNGQVFHDEMSRRDVKFDNNQEGDDDEVMITIMLDLGKTISKSTKDKAKIRYEDEDESMALLVTEDILAVMVPKEDRNSPACDAAKLLELEKLKMFDTYDIVDDEGQERITTTWVLTEKGDEVRARLTARGFQEEGDFPTDSPTVQKHSVRLLLAMACKYGWDISTTDITSAFLQGNLLDRDVYIKPPKEANMPNKLWKLNKCLYGLKDASRQWYFKVVNKLKELGFQKSFCDKGVFFLIKDNKLIGFIALHVDDFLHAGDQYFNKVIMPQVLAAFKVGKSETRDFLYTGFRIRQGDNCIKVDQEKYTKNVQIPSVDLKQLKDKKREMNQGELTLLRQLTGIVNWAQRSTRPDLSFETIELSTKFKGGLVEDLIQAKNVAARLKKLDVVVTTSNVGRFEECQVWVFTDAAFRNLNNNTDSCGGYFLMIVNIINGLCAPIEWRSGKLKRKVHSTLGAETLSLYSGIDAALAIKNMVKEMTNGVVDLKVKAITDNESARKAIYSESEVGERMLRADIAMIKDMIEDGRLAQVVWVAGKSMLADILTKRSVNKIPILDVLENGRLTREMLNLVNNTR